MSTQRVVLITGASSGVGRSAARILSDNGFRVIGTSRNPGGVEPIPHVRMLALDVRSDESVSRCVAQAGRIDVLVNNAGYELAGAVEEVSMDEARAQFDTNLFGVARMVNAVLPSMRQRKEGQIINVSSLAGMTAVPFMGIYSATKFALEGYTHALHHEVRPFNIHVSQIEVGFLNTPIFEHREVAAARIAEYDPFRQRALAAIRALEQKGPGPEFVGEKIRAIVTARTPRLRYVIGKEAALVSRLHRWMPETMFEKGVRSAFSLDK